MKLKDIKEEKIIEILKSTIKVKSPIKLGIGDDCAIISLKNREMLVSTDMFVEDVHFKIPPFSYYDLGRKVVCATLSDIVAMGGIPEALFLSIGLNRETEVSSFKDLINGINFGASKYRCQIAGGDTVRSENLVICSTVIGYVEKNLAVRRDGAQKGDLLCVTGILGESAIGLEAMLKGYPAQLFMKFIERHFWTTLKIAFARSLAMLSIATSMIDISDGLVKDAGNIAKQSNVSIIIDVDKIPKPTLTEEQKNFLMKDELHYAMFGGEDYELLFTINPEHIDKVEKISLETSTPFSVIGFVEEGHGVYIKKDNTIKEINYEGFEHF